MQRRPARAHAGVLLGMFVFACGEGTNDGANGGPPGSADFGTEGTGGTGAPGGTEAPGGTPATPDAGLPEGPIYDLTHADHHGQPAYRAHVDQFDVVSASLNQPTGLAELYVGHPVRFTAEVHVTAEPLEAPLYYGLRVGEAFCVIGDVGVDHLAEYFDAAARANAALAAQAPVIDTGSLADCAATRTCADEGEACVGVLTTGLPEGYDPEAALDANAAMPSAPPPDAVDDLPPPAEHVAWQCMRPTYAATLADDAAGAPTVALTLTPADLVGSVPREYSLSIEDVLPERCAPMAGDTTAELWVSFDPDFTTLYPGRPGGQDEAHEDLAATHDAMADVDATALRHARIYAQRFAGAEGRVVGPIHPDPGVDFELRHLMTGSSVVLLHEDVQQPWDFEVTALFSVDGALDPAHAEQLASAREQFHFSLQPAGEPREGCLLPEPLPAFEPRPLAIDDAAGHDTDTADAEIHAERTVKEHGFALHVAGELRTAVVSGDWACFDRFEVRGCFETALDQADAPGLGTENDCAALQVRLERVLPEPEGAEPSPNEPPPNEPQGQPEAEQRFREKAAGAGGCDQSLLEEYTARMRRYYELERSVKITNWYVMDYGRFLERVGVGDNWDYAPYHLPAGWFSGHIARSPWVGGDIKACLDSFEARGVVAGDHPYCYWVYSINRDYEAYRRLRRYFLTDDGRGGDYVAFKTDPFAKTNSWYNWKCSGIHSGWFAQYWGDPINTLRTWADRWKHPDPIHAQYDVTMRRNVTTVVSGRSEIGCATNGLYMLQRYRVTDDGHVEYIPDDDAFYTEYLPRVIEKGAAKARADEIWNQLVNSCTSFSAPAWSSEAIQQTRIVPALYPSKSVNFGTVNFGAEGGLVNDVLINKTTGDFVLTAGPKVRMWTDGVLAPELGGGIAFSLHDIFGAWLLGRFFSDVVSSHITAGFHVLTQDLWKLKYRLPEQFLIPMPPPLEKEVEKCKSYFYDGVPVGVELCAGIGGAVGIKGDGPNDEATLTVEKVGTTAGADGRPGIVGRVIPFIAMNTSGSIGVDFLAGVTGFKLNLDPTIELQFPIEPSLHWSLRWLADVSRLAWELVPGIRIGFDVVGFGGNLVFQVKFRWGDEYGWTIVEWDPLDLASETLLERFHVFSGETSL